jgi:N,N-dimethylformamidase beta subunit-like, C-terminal
VAGFQTFVGGRISAFANRDPQIQGFATEMSINLGETAQFKVKTHSPRYRIDVYRMGWYGGNGARLIQTIQPSVSLPQAQPECIVHNPGITSQSTTRLIDCGNWNVSASWAVPRDAVSGIYVARLVREDNEPESWRAEGGADSPSRTPPPSPHAYGASGLGLLRDALKEKRASHIIFVVRDDAGRSEILFQTSDPTWVAFNRYGGSSLYGSWAVTAGTVPTLSTRAFMVSYNRPIINRQGFVNDQFFNSEYPAVRWLERNGYNVSYFAGVDTDRRGDEIREHRVFLSAGHDTFWSGAQRRHIEAARDGGVNLAFFTSSAGFWRTRYQPSNDARQTSYRTLVSYKETHADGKIDPEKEEWTGTWRDSRVFNPQGSKPENAVTGTLHTVGGFRNDRLAVPAQYGKLRFWRNTDVARQKDGESMALGTGVLGHELDEDIDNGFRPAGLIRLSETTIDNVAYLQDLGTVYDAGTATHHLTMYRAPSGALVFSTGTAQYSWGLDSYHTNWTSGGDRVRPEIAGPVKAIQQATVNLLADMGVQPASLQPELIPAQPSQDKNRPLSNIAVPTDGAVVEGTVAIRGTATDMAGAVGGVEVSVDGGATWHPAVGTTAWSYEWQVPANLDHATILSRAIDDSTNIETESRSVRVRGSLARQTFSSEKVKP